MDNYKIKVNDEAESKEAQELFFELGYIVVNHVDNEKGFIVVSKEADSPFNFDYWCSVDKELTLPQLRDLVVLKRNDVKDATHEAACGTYLFLDSSGDWHFFHKHEAVFYTIDGDIPTFVDMPITLIKEQTQQPTEIEQGLISGADALNDYSNAQVSYDFGNGEYKWFPLDQCEFSIPQILKGHNDAHDSFALAKLVFRLKPRTITLNVEIPAPFEPKVGDIYYFINSSNLKGYGFNKFANDGDDECLTFYGAWRTEDEVKQVVAALRGGIKG